MVIDIYAWKKWKEVAINGKTLSLRWTSGQISDRIVPTGLRPALRLTGLRFVSRFNLWKGGKAPSRKACHSLYTSEFETGSN